MRAYLTLVWSPAEQVLSKAFRNRFLEVHVGDIPDDELVTILQHRCEARERLPSPPPQYETQKEKRKIACARVDGLQRGTRGA